MAAAAPITLEAIDWRLLTPLGGSGEEDAKIQVGVVEFHPSLKNRVVYTTRARNDNSSDLGKCRIVIHDFDGNIQKEGDVKASFTLRELTKRINEFRTKSQLSAMQTATSAQQTHPPEMLDSLYYTTPTSPMPYTVKMLGAVQSISFLDRDAIRCKVPPGYVKDDVPESGLQRLLIGFRRCCVVVSIFHTKQEKEEAYAQGVQVVAYIGPDNLDEYEVNEKAGKRQPSSFPIAISENILAYGCYDGGIRFYDIIQRKQAKAVLGPSGRGNPVLRLINANRIQSNSRREGATGCQTTLPRIISVCATGIGYLWELDLSIDLESGDILCFDIPPPLVSFDGLAAAVSGRGIPVKYPPTLSPTSVATLSPLSPCEQTDAVNSEFEVSFDPSSNLFFCVFSPDCIGDGKTREERLGMNGALVCWDLTTLPPMEWPPPVLPPYCVMQLPRTESGRVSADMVIPGISGASSNSLATVYITSSNELMASVTDLAKHGESVQLESNVSTLTDLKTFHDGQRGCTCYSICYSIASSWANSSLIGIGTSHGILLAEISGSSDVKRVLFPIQEVESVDRDDTACTKQQLSAKIELLESVNKELKGQLNAVRHESSKMFTIEERDELRSRVKGLMEQHRTELNAALAKVEALEKDLRSKNESSQALEANVDALKYNLDNSGEALEREIEAHRETALKFAALQEDMNNMEERGISETESRLTRCDYLATESSDSQLRKALSTAKETEESLRNYIALLEEDKSMADRDLENSRQQAEKYSKECELLSAKLRSDVQEQKSAIDSLVDLLEREKKDHETETAEQNHEISALKEELSDLRLNANKAKEETLAKLQAENAILKADAQTGNEIFMSMKIELQNARNELAEYQHHEHKCFHDCEDGS